MAARLYGIARDDMTIKWLYHLNRFHVPARGMTVDMVVNIGLLLLLGANNFVILYMSNIGYVFAHVLALSGFLLLRKDRPNWPRPIKVGPAMGRRPRACSRRSTCCSGLAASPSADLASYVGFYEFSGYPFFIGHRGPGRCRCCCSSTGGRCRTRSRSRSATGRPDVPTAEQMALLHARKTVIRLSASRVLECSTVPALLVAAGTVVPGVGFAGAGAVDYDAGWLCEVWTHRAATERFLKDVG